MVVHIVTTLYRRLSTNVRLGKWEIVSNLLCLMCEERDEDNDHLFFECHFNVGIWTRLLAWLGIYRSIFKWQEDVQWAVKSYERKKQQNAGIQDNFG